MVNRKELLKQSVEKQKLFVEKMVEKIVEEEEKTIVEGTKPEPTKEEKEEKTPSE